jgi:hypothetical protein
MINQIYSSFAFTNGGKNFNSRRLGGWVGLRACLDSLEKRNSSCPFRELKPDFSIFQPVS